MSVLEQGLTSIEVLVFDNASEDNTQSVMKEFSNDDRVIYHRHATNTGPSNNVLSGLAVAKGEFLAILSADDYYLPGYLEMAISSLRLHPEVCLAYCAIQCVNENGDLVDAPRHPGYLDHDYCGARNELADLLIFDNYVTPSASVYRRSMLMDVLQHEHSLVGAGDWFTAIQIANKYPAFIFFSKPGICYRLHSSQFSSEFYGSTAPLTDHIKIVENVLTCDMQEKIQGFEQQIAEHLQRRLGQYQNEMYSDIGLRGYGLIDKLHAKSLAANIPFFSVILTTFNRKNLLLDSLKSLFDQSFKDFEVVLVNDCGEPVEAILHDFSSLTITYVRQGSNQGLSAARNAGLKLSKGRYITYLDDDDIYQPDHLKCLSDALQHHPDSLIYTDVVYVQEKLDGNQRIELGRSFPTAHDAYDQDRLFVQNYIPVNTFAHPRSAISLVGEFDTSLTALEDWDMLLRLVQHYPVHRVKQVTVEVHQRVAGGADHMLAREQSRLLPLYRRLYARYPETDNERVQAGRQTVLAAQPAQVQPSWGISDWMLDRAPSPARVRAIQTMLKANPDAGTLGVAVVVQDARDLDALTATLESLGVQQRPVDQVWLVGQDIPGVAAGDVIEILAGDVPWPKRVSDRIAEGNAPDFLWLVHSGDRLVPHATLTMGEYRLRKPDPLIWYADEAVLSDGAPDDPMLKPDFNVDLLRSYPYVGRNLILSTAAIQAVGGLDDRLADLAPIDLLWRLVEQVGPPVVGHIPEVLQHNACSLMQWVGSADAMLWSPAVTQVHFERMGLDAQVESGPEPGVFRIAYPLPARPLVSIIIPTRDQLPVLQACIEGLMKHTAYTNYELLIVDNGSKDAGAMEFLSGLEQADMDQVRVLRWPHPFNFAAISNFAVRHARGGVLLFLDNDIQFNDQTHADWLERLLALALRAEVGLVGSRLDLPDGRGVDQCGQVLGLNHSMGAAFAGLDSNRHGYMKRMVVQQNVSALSGSCLMMRREVFDELGGFDAETFPVFFSDTDLSIKATQAGYLLALEPETGLLHMGGATRVLTDKFGFPARPYDDDFDHLYARLLPQLARDPNYHPACSSISPGYSLSPAAARLFEPLPGRPLPVVLASHEDWQGCALYRVLHPFRALSDELRLEGGLKEADFYLMDVARMRPDTLVLQGSWLRPDILPRISRYRNIVGTKVALEFDDYVPNIPTRSIYRNRVAPGAIRNMRRAIENVDWLVVSTPELAQEYASFHDDIRVAKNGLYRAWWGQLNGQRRVGRKLRVGWAGGSGHAGDLAEVRSVVKELQDEVEWVFMGMKPDGIACEYHPGVDIQQYPEKLASLNLDLAIAPLEVNQFNRCKSNLRILELGACGVPMICTDIEPYRCGLPVTLVSNRHQDWVQAIRSHVADPDALAKMGDALRTVVLSDWMLEGDFLDQWAYAWGCLPEK